MMELYRRKSRSKGRGCLIFVIFLKAPIMLFFLSLLETVLCGNVLSWFLILNVYHVTSIKICILKEVI